MAVGRRPSPPFGICRARRAPGISATRVVKPPRRGDGAWRESARSSSDQPTGTEHPGDMGRVAPRAPLRGVPLVRPRRPPAGAPDWSSATRRPTGSGLRGSAASIGRRLSPTPHLAPKRRIWSDGAGTADAARFWSAANAHGTHLPGSFVGDLQVGRYRAGERGTIRRQRQSSRTYAPLQIATFSRTALSHAWCIASRCASSRAPEARNGRIVA